MANGFWLTSVLPRTTKSALATVPALSLLNMPMSRPLPKFSVLFWMVTLKVVVPSLASKLVSSPKAVVTRPRWPEPMASGSPMVQLLTVRRLSVPVLFVTRRLFTWPPAMVEESMSAEPSRLVKRTLSSPPEPRSESAVGLVPLLPSMTEFLSVKAERLLPRTA